MAKVAAPSESVREETGDHAAVLIEDGPVRLRLPHGEGLDLSDSTKGGRSGA